MRKVIIPLLLTAVILLSSCVSSDNSTTEESSTEVSAPTASAVTETVPTTVFEEESTTSREDMYSLTADLDELMVRMFEIDDCTDPEELSRRLTRIGYEDITYIKLTASDSDEYDFEAPYENFSINAEEVLSDEPYRHFSTDTWLFFEHWDEDPIFAMDSCGSYIVTDIIPEVSGVENSKYIVTVMRVSSLQNARYRTFGGDVEMQNNMRGWVESIKNYIEFEDRLARRYGLK